MTPTPKFDSDFKTSDLYFAAYLQVAGVLMIRTEREPKGKVTFVFDTSIANLEELRNGWFSQTAKVPALNYANAIKSLKSIVHM
jgi:hypothetical protein